MLYLVVVLHIIVSLFIIGVVLLQQGKSADLAGAFGGRSFDVDLISTTQPGFAISLEPSGGVPAPTGPILFAVAPGQ